MTPDDGAKFFERLGTAREPIMKAMKALQEIANDPVQRAAYERRLKWVREQEERESDYQKTMAALREARAREIDAFAGQVQFCQRLLGEPPTPMEELASKPVEELRRLADELHRRVDPAS